MKQKAEIEGGATIWARQTIDSEIFEKPGNWFKIWFYLVNRVNHKDNKHFKRGECFLKYDWISEKAKVSRNEIDKCLRFLKRSTMIATQKSTRGMVVKVLKYDFYQTLDNYYGDILVDTPVETKSTQSRHYKQECKNDKNEDNKNIILHTENKFSGKEVSEVIYLFKNLNPLYKDWYKRKSVRNTCIRLLEDFGIDKIRNAIKFLECSAGDQFVSSVTTPTELLNKWGKLQLQYIKKVGSKPKQIIKI